MPTRVSVNSENCMGFKLAVKGGAAIAVEIRAERSSPRIESGTNCRGSVGNLGGFANHSADTASFWLVLLAAFWWSIERGWPSERRARNYVVLRIWHVLDAHENIARRSDGQPLLYKQSLHDG